MTARFGGPEERMPWDEIWQKFSGRRGDRQGFRMTGKTILVIAGIALTIWLFSGIYTVGPGEVGVVRQFGREVKQTDPGLHYHLPIPIQRVDKVNLAKIRKLSVGFIEVAPGRYQEVPHESLMLTGDENIVNIHVITYYKVKDPSQFLFNVKDIERVLKTALEVALRGVVGKNAIDFVMTEGRAEVQVEALKVLQELMDSYKSGIMITEVRLQEVDAPKEVRDAFHDVVRAKEDKDRLIRQAEGYAADIIPKARGEKEKMIIAAEAYKEQRIIEAKGDAERFLEVLKEYRKAPEVTRRRLYLETIEHILPAVEKIIIDPEGGGNLLQFLPLKDQGKLERSDKEVQR